MSLIFIIIFRSKKEFLEIWRVKLVNILKTISVSETNFFRTNGHSLLSHLNFVIAFLSQFLDTTWNQSSPNFP
jgi:hypothetical protein